MEIVTSQGEVIEIEHIELHVMIQMPPPQKKDTDNQEVSSLAGSPLLAFALFLKFS